nr:hypothetical protein CFP56_66156 [Quercus suber]
MRDKEPEYHNIRSKSSAASMSEVDLYIMALLKDYSISAHRSVIKPLYIRYLRYCIRRLKSYLTRVRPPAPCPSLISAAVVLDLSSHIFPSPSPEQDRSFLLSLTSISLPLPIHACCILLVDSVSCIVASPDQQQSSESVDAISPASASLNIADDNNGVAT